MGALRVEAGVSPQRLVEGLHVGPDVGGGAEPGLRRAFGQAERLSVVGLDDRPGQAGGGIDLEALVLEGALERPLQAGEKLHSLEASQADLPIEGGLRAHRPFRAGSTHVPGDGADDPEHRVEDCARVGSGGDGIGWGGHRGHSKGGTRAVQRGRCGSSLLDRPRGAGDAGPTEAEC